MNNGNGSTYTTQTWEIGDSVEVMQGMKPETVDLIITSPPYWGLRDYGVEGQIGLEGTLEEYHARLLEVTAECMRLLKPTGVMFWNHGDSYYAGGGKAVEQSYKRQTAINTGAYPDHAPSARFRSTMGKCLTMQNERLIIRMIDEQGWILRNRIIWKKPNGMPSSVTDRFANKHEPVYMLVKNNKPLYYYNNRTGVVQQNKPPGTKGEEGVDWGWKDVVTESGTKRKKVSNWRGRSYWFDLDAIRKPYTQPMNRWGGVKLKANGTSEWDKGTGQTSYRDRDMRPNPLGKTPGDVVEMTPTEWLDYCADIWDLFADEQGDIMRIPTQPYPGSHFATFPTTLVELAIKAACPAEICPKCGHIRERIVDHEFVPQQDVSEDKGVRGAQDQKPMYTFNKWQGVPRGSTIHNTTGWTSCNCNAGWIAGTALDPFAGSGTVLKVCRLLNRNAIGIELNPDYESMMRERSMAHTPPLGAYV